MSEQDDRVFIRHFSVILVGLVVFTVLIIGLSLIIHNQLTLSENVARDAAKEERISPVAGVYAGETGRAAAAAAAAEAATETAAAFDGSTDGELIYRRVCETCHVAGAAGAPVMEASAWGDRLDQDFEVLVANAIDGIGAMPPRGGRSDLTDEQVEASVEHMLALLEE